MSDLELTLPSKTVELAFGTHLEAFPSDYFRSAGLENIGMFSHEDGVEYEDCRGLGLSFKFKDGPLEGVFLYINEDGYKRFKKSCTYLDEAFWRATLRYLSKRLARRAFSLSAIISNGKKYATNAKYLAPMSGATALTKIMPKIMKKLCIKKTKGRVISASRSPKINMA